MSKEFNETVDTVRVISAALPEAAKSGHPGAPMGCAPMACTLYLKVMRYCPTKPQWIARDRFVLSNGHACALQYTLLSLMGFGIEIDELKSFRSLKSRLAGHPERGLCPGVEVTTGPLGQGIAQAVGLAVASKMMAARFNKADFPLFQERVYGIVGDGCLQEGVSAEAASLAGHWGLGNLIFLYDSNGITIDGSTELSFTEDVGLRFKAYGWQVIHIDDADTDYETIEKAIKEAQECTDKPSLIIARTTIGYGSKVQGNEKTHGAPLGEEDLRAARKRFKLPDNDIWQISESVKNYCHKRTNELDKLYQDWRVMLTKYQEKYPSDYDELKRRMDGKTYNLDEIERVLPKYTFDSKAMSTRALSGLALNVVCSAIPSVVGGSADLQGSNSVAIKGETDFQRSTPHGRYIRFGIREHGMVAITLGIAAYGAGFKPFCATFANFITYAWGALRLAALSDLPILCIATHDSIELGEDGPTHQPIETAALCRATPNLYYMRPADGNEVSGAYSVWLASTDTPMVLALCRSNTPMLKGTSAEMVKKGGYYIKPFEESSSLPKIIIGSSGTEVALALSAADKLKDKYNIGVLSIPCWKLLEQQPPTYLETLFPKDAKKLYIEACNTLGCEKWFDSSVGMRTFGSSGPKDMVQKYYGFDVENICNRIRQL